MLYFKKRFSLLAIFSLLLTVSILAFQNCSRTTFSKLEDVPPDVVAKCNGGVCPEEGSCSMRMANTDLIEVRPVGKCTCSSGVKSAMDGSTLVCGEEVVCKNDEQRIGNRCEKFVCKTYQEILPQSDGSFNVPKRDVATGICYFTKMVNGSPIDPVTKQVMITQTRVTENIISSNHDATDGNIKPKNLGYKKISIKLNDKRSLKLVGPEKNDTSKLYVDNYFLIRMNSDSYTKAYGTRDASYRVSGLLFSDYILYNDKKVPLVNFVDGGTAHVDPIDITDQIRLGVLTDLHMHALDCGAGQFLNDIYLLLQ